MDPRLQTGCITKHSDQMSTFSLGDSVEISGWSQGAGSPAAGQPNSPGRAGSRTGLDFSNFPRQCWPSPIKPAASQMVPKVHVLPGHPYYLLYDVQAAKDSHMCVTSCTPSCVSSGGVSSCGKTSPVTVGPSFPVTLETPVKH